MDVTSWVHPRPWPVQFFLGLQGVRCTVSNPKIFMLSKNWKILKPKSFTLSTTGTQGQFYLLRSRRKWPRPTLFHSSHPGPGKLGPRAVAVRRAKHSETERCQAVVCSALQLTRSIFRPLLHCVVSVCLKLPAAWSFPGPVPVRLVVSFRQG